MSSTTSRAAIRFSRELDACQATHLSLEAAQPGLEAAILNDVPSKSILFGVLDLGG